MQELRARLRWHSLALDPVHAFASALERAYASALFTHACRKEAAHTVPLPSGEALDLAYGGSFRTAEQGIHLSRFGAVSEPNLGLPTFPLCFSTGLFRKFHRTPDPFERDLPVSELLDRCDTGKSVPDLDQPLQGPGTCDCFPFVLGGEHGFLSIPSLSIVCWDLRSGTGRCEMKWHVVLLFLALQCLHGHSIHRSPRTTMQVPCSLSVQEPPENYVCKRLDSGSVDQPRMCHAQIPESCAYHESETQAECRHRGSRSRRRGDPHPHLSSHSRSNQLFPWTATCVQRSSGTGKAEQQRKPPRLSASRDRLRERLSSTTGYEGISENEPGAAGPRRTALPTPERLSAAKRDHPPRRSTDGRQRTVCHRSRVLWPDVRAGRRYARPLTGVYRLLAP